MSIRAPHSAGMERLLPRPVAILGALIAPLIVSALLSLLRGVLANTSAALILVLVIVAAACTGYRIAGFLAAVSCGVWFDFFLTAPYLRFSVADAADIETLIMLVLLGIAINEIIQWGRRYQARLNDRDTYLHALLAISDRPSNEGTAWVDAVGTYLLTLLDLDACSWVDAIDDDVPRLDRDGGVRLRGQQLWVDQDGLPTVNTVALPIRPGDPASPGFILTAATHIARPSLEQRRLAGALADQVGAVLRGAER